MNGDESLKRQLRFSLFLQVAGAVMFAIATLVRAFAVGLDLVTIILALVTVGVGAAALFTRSRMQTLGS
ncbi:MAG: hypothetical protein VW362_10965 [Candidatus Nanopelagicales bacterium]|jgi:hypothetical protein